MKSKVSCGSSHLPSEHGTHRTMGLGGQAGKIGALTNAHSCLYFPYVRPFPASARREASDGPGAPLILVVVFPGASAHLSL